MKRIMKFSFVEHIHKLKRRKGARCAAAAVAAGRAEAHIHLLDAALKVADCLRDCNHGTQYGVCDFPAGLVATLYYENLRSSQVPCAVAKSFQRALLLQASHFWSLHIPCGHHTFD